MMNAYAYAYGSIEIERALTITLTSTAKNGKYSEYASASAYDYAIADYTLVYSMTHVILEIVMSAAIRGKYVLLGRMEECTRLDFILIVE